MTGVLAVHAADGAVAFSATRVPLLPSIAQAHPATLSRAWLDRLSSSASVRVRTASSATTEKVPITTSDPTRNFLSLTQDLSDGRWSAAHWPAALAKALGKPIDESEAMVGTWTGPSADLVTTGFAMLAFLGRGYEHKSANSHRDTVRRGIQFLVKALPASGQFDADPVVQAVAADAIFEAYGMTMDVELREPCERALAAILRTQRNGGWSATNRPDDDLIDATATAWNIFALRSAKMANLDVQEALMATNEYVREAWQAANATAMPQDPYGRSIFPALFRSATRSATAAQAFLPEANAEGAVLSLWLGFDSEETQLQSLANSLMHGYARPSSEQDPIQLLLTRMALFRVGGSHGNKFLTWHMQYLSDTCMGDDGAWGGSWDPSMYGPRGQVLGRLLTTILHRNAANNYYIYQIIEPKGKQEKK